MGKNNNKPNTLCWYCKSVYDGDHHCPWVDQGDPVPGWEVRDVHALRDNPEIHNPMSCQVVSCPLFERATRSISFSEFINQIVADIHMQYGYAHSHPKAALQRYIKDGYEVPEWAKHELMSHIKQTEQNA